MLAPETTKIKRRENFYSSTASNQQALAESWIETKLTKGTKQS